MSHEVVNLTKAKTDKSKWIILKLPKTLVILTRTELLAVLAASPELFTKAVKRGKWALRHKQRAERAGDPRGGSPG